MSSGEICLSLPRGDGSRDERAPEASSADPLETSLSLPLAFFGPRFGAAPLFTALRADFESCTGLDFPLELAEESRLPRRAAPFLLSCFRESLLSGVGEDLALLFTLGVGSRLLSAFEVASFRRSRLGEGLGDGLRLLSSGDDRLFLSGFGDERCFFLLTKGDSSDCAYLFSLFGEDRRLFRFDLSSSR